MMQDGRSAAKELVSHVFEILVQCPTMLDNENLVGWLQEPRKSEKLFFSGENIFLRCAISPKLATTSIDASNN